MKLFCRKFWTDDDHMCPQCAEVLEEAEKEMERCPCIERTEEDKAALDCHGQP